MDAPAIFSSFLVKVASRCNLDCDYCYVYHHADQSWRSMPKLLAQEHRVAFAERLAEYAAVGGLKRCAVIFHGGEPLLAGAHQIRCRESLYNRSIARHRSRVVHWAATHPHGVDAHIHPAS